MNYSQWESMYRCILADFNFSEADDERAAILLAELCAKKNVLDPACLHLGNEVTVCGAAARLESEISEYGLYGTVIAADSAVARLHLRPSLIVTDLDGDILHEIEYSRQGSVTAIHAHGSNMNALREYVPLFDGPIIPTVQCRPVLGTYNFGGFTDGDRAAMMAYSLGARKIHLRGFDFAQPFPKAGKDISLKKKKLQWAERILSNIDACLLIP